MEKAMETRLIDTLKADLTSWDNEMAAIQQELQQLMQRRTQLEQRFIQLVGLKAHVSQRLAELEAP